MVASTVAGQVIISLLTVQECFPSGKRVIISSRVGGEVASLQRQAGNLSVVWWRKGGFNNGRRRIIRLFVCRRKGAF